MFYTNVYNSRSSVYHIGYNDAGEKFITKEKFKPTLGTITKDSQLATKKTYKDELIEVRQFDDVKSWYDFRKHYSDVFSIYDDIDPCYQFINEFYKDKIEYDLSKIKVIMYDIETTEDPITGGFPHPYNAHAPITSIALKDIFGGKIWCVSTEKMNPDVLQHITIDGKLYYKFCYSEEELLKIFVKLFDKIKPDILCGYNSDFFDDPYIINRIEKVLGKELLKFLSPTRGKVESVYIEKEEGQNIYRNTIEGVALVDFAQLYQKNVKKYESNSLSFVSGVELGEDKVDYEEYDNLEELRLNDPQKYLEYNIKDVELLDQINKKRKLIELVITVAYFTKSNFEDVMSPVRTWDNFIYSYLSKQGISIPPRNADVPVKFKIPGGYVKKDIVPGIYKNVISLDLKALYPSLSITLNISPDTLIEDDSIKVNLRKIDNRILNKQIIHNDPNTILTGSGFKFRKDKIGFYPSLFKLLMSERDVAKGKKLKIDSERQLLKEDDPKRIKLDNEYYDYHTFEQSIKLLMNSGYGILATEKGCRYYDPRLAASITLSGQLSIQSASNVVEGYLKEKYLQQSTLLFTHTDSCFIDLNGVCDNVEVVDKFYKEHLDQLIVDCYEELCKYLNARENLLILKREKICSHFLLPAPARYACLILDKEGVRYDKPKLDITGLEVIKSSTPKIIKPYLKECLIKIMKEEDVKSYIADLKKEFFNMSPEQIAFPRSANNLSKWINPDGSYVSRIPIGVRAAHNFNKYLDKVNIKNLNKITEGDKIKFIYMRVPNPIMNQNVVGFIRKFPSDDLKQYVDYNTQFYKCFYKIIESISEKVEFNIDQAQENLEDIF